MKFVSFVIKNKDFPFAIKKKVIEAALLSSITSTRVNLGLELGLRIFVCRSMQYSKLKELGL